MFFTPLNLHNRFAFREWEAYLLPGTRFPW